MYNKMVRGIPAGLTSCLLAFLLGMAWVSTAGSQTSLLHKRPGVPPLDPDPIPGVPGVFCFRITDIAIDKSDLEGNRFHFLFETLNWSDAPAAGVYVAIAEGSAYPGAPFFSAAAIDANGRPIGPASDPPPGNDNPPNNWIVSGVTNTSITWRAGTPIPFIDLIDAGQSSVCDACDLVPGCESDLSDGCLGADIPDFETIDDTLNVLDGFQLTVEDFDVGDILTFNWFLVDQNGDPIGTAGFGNSFGFGTVNIVRVDNGSTPGPVFEGNTGFSQSQALFYDTVYIVPDPATFAAEFGGGITAQFVNPADNIFDAPINTSLLQTPTGPLTLTPHTGFAGPIGIDHHEPTNKVVLSVNYPTGQPYNFELADVFGNHQQFSNISGLTDEVYVATARDDGGGMSIGGFLPGEFFTGTGVAGHVARISPDGSNIQNPWAILPGEPGLLRGGLHVDRTGVFGGDLIVVTTAGNVWRINSAGTPTNLTTLNTHLEGVTTVPDDAAKYGPWAGKILAGAEQQGRVYAIDTQGQATFFELGIAPEQMDIIPANENFFGVDYAAQLLWTAQPSEFTNIVGDILIAQESPGLLFHVRWDGTQFRTSQIAQVTQWEDMTFSTSPVALQCELEILSPQDGAVVSGDLIEVTVLQRINGGIPPVVSQCDINGIPAVFTSDSTFSATLQCVPGTTLPIVATCVVQDAQGNVDTCRASIEVFCPVRQTCTVDIISPEDGSIVCPDNVEVTAVTKVSGGIGSATLTGCDINGVPATVLDDTLVSATIPLDRGFNTVTVTCIYTDAQGNQSTCSDSIQVFLDRKKPFCHFELDEDGVKGTMYDEHSGILSITPIEIRNGVLTVDDFTVGDHAVDFRIDFVNPEKHMFFSIDIRDVCGNRFNCDPVFLSLAGSGQHESFTFPEVERYLELRNQGMAEIEIVLNENPFSLTTSADRAASGVNTFLVPEYGIYTIDLQKLLRPGDNSMSIVHHGPPGSSARIFVAPEASQRIDLVLEPAALPSEFRLSQNYPNPFNPGTEIRFAIPASASGGVPVQVQIYNLTGALIRTLVDEQKLPGVYTVPWNGASDHGRPVASGIYIYRIIAGDFTQTKRMILLK